MACANGNYFDSWQCPTIVQAPAQDFVDIQNASQGKVYETSVDVMESLCFSPHQESIDSASYLITLLQLHLFLATLS